MSPRPFDVHTDDNARTELYRALYKHFREASWINYPSAVQALTTMASVLTESNRASSRLVIIGNAGNGKTWLLNRFRSSNSPDDPHLRDLPLARIITMSAPGRPCESLFYDNLLKDTFTWGCETDSLEKKRADARDFINYVGTQVLVIDDIDNLLNGSATFRRNLMRVVEDLASEFNLAIILSGRREAMDLLPDAYQPIHLAKWKLDDTFRRMLDTYDSLLPLPRSSNLSSMHVAKMLHSASNGAISGVHWILAESLLLTLYESEDHISPSVIAAQVSSYKTSLHYKEAHSR